MNRTTGIALVFVILMLASCQTGMEVIEMERFAPCPGTPNCVSSYATDELHAIDALPLVDSIDEIVGLVQGLPRTNVVLVEGDYLHATFTSRLFRFVDDVEFLIDREAGVTQVRSASRVGAGDLGVNRARVEEIRALMEGGDA